MQDFFYRCLIRVAGITGVWFFKAMAWCVTTGYFMFCPRRVAESIHFYKALFPGRGAGYYILCAWRQFHNFTTVFIDRWLVHRPDTIVYSYEGWEYIEKSIHDGTGAVLLMSHVGNWELGARYIVTRTDGPAIKLLLYLGEKQGEQIEKMQKNDLALQGVKIVSIQRDESSPFELVEGLRFIKSGGFVSMSGDRLWSAAQRSVPVRFVGREARIPAAPFEFALLAGAPLIVFFVNRIGNGRYHCTLFPPFLAAAASRNERDAAISRAAQHYADLLEAMVRQHPFEWYHFERFIDLRAS